MVELSSWLGDEHVSVSLADRRGSVMFPIRSSTELYIMGGESLSLEDRVAIPSKPTRRSGKFHVL